MSSSSWRPERGEVVLVRFPFVETGGQVRVKPRPALVISSKAIHDHSADIVVIAISSRPNSRPLPTDYRIEIGTTEFVNAGLKLTSWIKVSNLATLPKVAVARRLGHLSPGVQAEISNLLRAALGL